MVKFSLYWINNYHASKAYGEDEVRVQCILLHGSNGHDYNVI